MDLVKWKKGPNPSNKRNSIMFERFPNLTLSRLLTFVFTILTIVPVILFEEHLLALLFFPLNYLFFGIAGIFMVGMDVRVIPFFILIFLLLLYFSFVLFSRLKKIKIRPVWRYALTIWGIYLFFLWTGLIFYLMGITWHWDTKTIYFFYASITER